MLCTAPTLRTAAIGCRMQPTLLTPTSFHTAPATPLRSSDSSSPTSTTRRVPLLKRQVSFKKSSPSSTRHASTATTSPPSTQASASPSTTDTQLLDWNTFFKLRKTRRWYQLGSSIGSGLSGFVLGAEALTRADMDKLVSQIPLDPFITLGMITFLCGGVGWLAGPVFGTATFNWRNRGVRGQMDDKEKEFYRRVKKYRVDPSASSMGNPVPDYYGEKIASVAGYRQWLKDQRAFNRKRQHYL